jgi:hypothetical protein
MALVRAATACEVPSDSDVSTAIGGRIVLLDGTVVPVWSWRGP